MATILRDRAYPPCDASPMTSLPPVAGVFRSELQWQVVTGPFTRTINHWKFSGGPMTSAEALGVAQLMYEAAAPQFAPYLHTGHSLIGCRVTDLTSPDAGDATYEHTTAGTLTGDVVPANCNVLIVHHVARRYRGGKPRNYLPLGGADQLVNPNTWQDVLVSDVLAAWMVFEAVGSVISFGGIDVLDFSNVSYTLDKLPRATPLVESIVSSTVSSTPGSQRRRLRPR